MASDFIFDCLGDATELSVVRLFSELERVSDEGCGERTQ